MKRNSAAEAFSLQVDAVLARSGKSETENVMSMEDARDLEIVRRLAATDFSRSSRKLASLQETIPLAVQRRQVTPLPIRRIALLPLSVGAFALAAVLVQCTYPGGIQGLTKAVADFIVIGDRIKLGPHTSAAQYVYDPGKARKAAENTWSVITRAGAFSGPTPEGMTPVASEFPSCELARGKALFDFKTPETLPTGYDMRQVFVGPGGDHVIQVFQNSEENQIVLSQKRHAPIVSVRTGTGTVTVTGTFTGVAVTVSGAGENQLIETELDGTKAAWFAGGNRSRLVWETNSITYDLGATDLVLEEAKRIAMSLK